jgi:hypothetical protein
MGADDSLHGFGGFSLLFLHEQHEQCSLLGNTYGIVLQLVLGVIAFLALVIKRLLEPEKVRRSWSIWAADAAKQAIGALSAHVINMLLSTGFVVGMQSECLFYMVNFLADAVVGLFINIILLKVVDGIASTGAIRASGDYGRRGFSWAAWFSQLSVWLGIIAISKLVVVCAVVLPFKAPLYTLVELCFAPLARSPKTELFLIMVLIPLLFNAVAFWVQDAFLMKPPAPEDELTGAMWTKENFTATDEDVEHLVSLLRNESVAAESRAASPEAGGSVDPNAVDPHVTAVLAGHHEELARAKYPAYYVA